MALLKSQTVSISIQRDVRRVYQFVFDLENLPKWAGAFAKSVRRSGDDYIVETDRGPLKIRMASGNNYGVLDHHVSPAPGIEIYVPMRVITNGTGSEVLFTLFQYPDMDDARFTEDLKMVRRDLESLKKILET